MAAVLLSWMLPEVVERWAALRGGGKCAGARSLLQEVRQQPLPLFRQEAFGVVLHPLEGPRLVADAHDFVLVGPAAHLELRRQRAVANDQAVVAGGRERVGHAGVNR